jgi:hypothetical protein
MGSPTTAHSRSDAHRLLTIYLRDHRAGAASGVSLAHRIRRANDGTDVGTAMASIERDIDQDRRALEQFMARFDVEQSTVKNLLGSAVERVARLKANGRLIGYSPLSVLVELEALAAGVFTKRNLWLSLAAIADQVDELDHEELGRLIDRATAQLDVLSDLHRTAAERAFGAAAAPASSVV